MNQSLPTIPPEGHEILTEPLPEPVCNCDQTDGYFGPPINIVGKHSETCPCHPRNRLVKVLPGWLARLKVKPEGLMWANMGQMDWTPYPYQLQNLKDDKDNQLLAYALPARVLAEIEGKEKDFQNPVLSAEPNDRDCISADESRHPRKHVGPNREFNSPDRDLSAAPPKSQPSGVAATGWQTIETAPKRLRIIR